MKPLVVPGRLESLAEIRKHVQAAAAEAGLNTKDAYRLALAVDEVATNIITHGYAEAGREGTVDVMTDADNDHLTVALEDSGVAFDPTEARQLDIDRPVEERKAGGMGIYLAIRGVDRFEYQRVGSKNRNIFIMNRRHASSGEA